MLVVKNPSTNAGDIMRHGFDPWVMKIPWRRAWQPTPLLLPGESHGQRSLAGYSPSRLLMNELEILYYLSMHFPGTCCIGCIRNKGPVSMNGDMFLKWVLMCEERSDVTKYSFTSHLKVLCRLLLCMSQCTSA